MKKMPKDPAFSSIILHHLNASPTISLYLITILKIKIMRLLKIVVLKLRNKSQDTQSLRVCDQSLLSLLSTRAHFLFRIDMQRNEVFFIMSH